MNNIYMCGHTSTTKMMRQCMRAISLWKNSLIQMDDDDHGYDNDDDDDDDAI